MDESKKVEYRHSYGVIPLIGTPSNWKLLLIDQRDLALEHYWTFPKGTPENGESPRETAVRETAEEVGITCEVVDEEFSFTERYAFEQNGVHIEKSVTFFVGRAPSEVCTLQEKEVRGAKWCTPKEAKTLMTFRNKSGVIDALVESGAPTRLLAN